jgi:hypothetical protein
MNHFDLRYPSLAPLITSPALPVNLSGELPGIGGDFCHQCDRPGPQMELGRLLLR